MSRKIDAFLRDYSIMQKPEEALHDSDSSRRVDAGLLYDNYVMANMHGFHFDESCVVRPRKRTDTGFISSIESCKANVPSADTIEYGKGRLATGGVNVIFEEAHIAPKGSDGINYSKYMLIDYKEEYKKYKICGPPYYYYEGLKDAPLPIKIFLVKLQMWDELDVDKLISPSEIWNRTLEEGPSFNDWYCDFFEYSIKFSLMPESERSSIISIPVDRLVIVKNYSSLFSPKGLLFWKEAKDDRQYYNYDQDSIIDREGYRILLDRVCAQVDWDDILVPYTPPPPELSSMSCKISGGLIESSLPYYNYVDEKDFRYMDHSMRARRAIVYVDPSSIRDTLVLDYRSSNTVRFLEVIVRQILTYIPISAYSYGGDSLSTKKAQFKPKKGRTFALRDIKKCGLTMNRDLLKWTLEYIGEKCKSFTIQRLSSFYSDPEIIDLDGSLLETRRGSGLGQANMLVTLVECVIAQYLCDQINKPLHILIGNDDALACGDSDLLEKWCNAEMDFGNIPNIKKSIVSRAPLFFEDYDINGFRDKESLAALSIAWAYFLPIDEAKQVICAQSERFVNGNLRDLLSDLIKSKGYEFIEDEYMLHYECGGWFDLRKRGLKTTLRDISYVSEIYGDPKALEIVNTVQSRSLKRTIDYTLEGWDFDKTKAKKAGKIAFKVKRYPKLKNKLRKKVKHQTVLDAMLSFLPGDYQVPEEWVLLDTDDLPEHKVIHQKKLESYRRLSTRNNIIGQCLNEYHLPEKYRLWYISIGQMLDCNEVQSLPEFEDVEIPDPRTFSMFSYLGIMASLDTFARYGYPYQCKLCEKELLDCYDLDNEGVIELSPIAHKCTLDPFSEKEEDQVEETNAEPEIQGEYHEFGDQNVWVANDLWRLMCTHHKGYGADEFYSTVNCPICRAYAMTRPKSEWKSMEIINFRPRPGDHAFEYYASLIPPVHREEEEAIPMDDFADMFG
jgi:hypothetical protein